MTTALDGALWCAERGWPVFPVKGLTGTDVRDSKKPTVAWSTVHTTDPAMIREWLAGANNAYGVFLKGAGLVVIDDDGDGELQRWATDLGVDLPETFTVKTAQGYHYYFDAQGEHFGNLDKEFVDRGYNIDVRGNGDSAKQGGYVLGPHSIHYSRVIYEPVNDMQPVPLPRKLADFLHGMANPQAHATTATTGTGTPNLNDVLAPHAGSQRSYWEKAATNVLDDLKALQGLPEGLEPRWDRATYAHAARLVELGNALGASFEHDFMAAAPTCATFGQSEHEHKWQSAVTAIGAKPADPPRDHTSTLVPSTPTPTTPVDAATAFQAAVETEAHRMRVRETARDLVAREKATDIELVEGINLADFLAQPDEETPFLIDKVWPHGGRVVLAAQQKAGKSTLADNVTRSLVDGVPFLGRYECEQVGRVVVIDNELSPNTKRRWLKDHNIQHAERVDLFTLKGKLSTFNILEESTRQRWATQIGPADVVIFDCLRPALDALGLDEHRQAGIFLNALDELADQAGIPNMLVVHHMGHVDGERSNERARGDSRIQDWPDANWKLVRDKQADGQAAGDVPRYFNAVGRDVDEPQQRITMDPQSRRMTIVGGSRADLETEKAMDDVLAFIAENPGSNATQIDEGVASFGAHSRASIRKARGALKTAEKVTIQEGPRRAQLYYVNAGHNLTTPVRHSAPPVRQQTAEKSVRQCASAYIDTHAGALTETTSNQSHNKPKNEEENTRCKTCKRRLIIYSNGTRSCSTCDHEQTPISSTS